MTMNTLVVDPNNGSGVSSRLLKMAGIFNLYNTARGCITYAWASDPKQVMKSLGIDTNAFESELEILRDMIDDSVRPFIIEALNPKLVDDLTVRIERVVVAWSQRAHVNQVFITCLLERVKENFGVNYGDD